MHITPHSEETKLKMRKSPNSIRYVGEHIEIILTDKKDKETARVKIDLFDYNQVKEYRWCLGNTGYAKSNRCPTNTMHTLIMGIGRTSMEVDHINEDKIDNRRNNLRWVSRRQNVMNKRKCGAYYDKRRNRWYAQFNKIHLGMYDSKKEALKSAWDYKLSIFNK